MPVAAMLLGFSVGVSCSNLLLRDILWRIHEGLKPDGELDPEEFAGLAEGINDVFERELGKFPPILGAHLKEQAETDERLRGIDFSFLNRPPKKGDAP